MLKQDSEHIANLLATANATAEIDGYFKGIYPLMGDVDADYPFIAYRLNEQQPQTKDGLPAYNLTLSVVGETYNSIAQGYDLLKKYLKENYPQYRFTGGNSAYILEKTLCVADLNYNIKIN